MCHACLIEFKIIHIIMGFKVTQTHHILITYSEFEARFESANGIRQTCGWQRWPTTQKPPSSSSWFPGWWHPYWRSPEACLTSQIKLGPWADPPWDLPASWTCPWLCSQEVHLSSRPPYPRLSVWLQEHPQSCHRWLCLYSPSSAPGNPNIQEQKTRSAVSRHCWRCPILLLSFSL